MKIERLPLNALRAFTEAARENSFKKAAIRLSVTSGAVSRQVKQLESRLGVVLFERHANGVLLTEAGKVLLDDVQAGLSLIASGVEQITQRSSEAFELVISAPPSFLQLWLLPRLHQFEARERNINISLDADANLTPPLWLPNRAKLSLRYGQGPWQGVNSIRLFEDVLFPVCSPVLFNQNKIKVPGDLLTQTLLAVEWQRHTPASSHVPNWNNWFESVGIKNQRLPVPKQYSLYSLALDQAIAGQGVVLASYPLIADRLESGVLVRPFEEKYSLASRFAYDLILPTNGEAPEAARRFSEWLTQEAARFKDAPLHP
ncbi:MAG: LysR family transcriptional regulator [Halomonas sp.]|nr:LysR substrate-binding domain-containing protein [Halomonas sp.]MBP5979285.1 LysR family transcriptional regulator [Halomonas sp.]